MQELNGKSLHKRAGAELFPYMLVIYRSFLELGCHNHLISLVYEP